MLQNCRRKDITTIEGLGTVDHPHPVQQAWVEHVVSQCGYCQPGFMMATVALINKNPNPSLYRKSGLHG
ncbi:MAG: isoquinoline 1-oxidoreductase alpha subunit [Halioglobus sp.]|jgi:isoquinoline 1-oxidoreductase alpha subunit